MNNSVTQSSTATMVPLRCVKPNQRLHIVVLVSTVFCVDQMLCTVIIPILHRELCLIDNNGTLSVLLQTNLTANNNFSEISHQECFENDIKIKSAFLVGTKGLVQIFVNPLVGKMIDNFFPALVLLVGIVANMLSTSLYAFGDTYNSILLARAINGIGAASIGSASLALIADTFHKATERNRYIGIVNFFLFAGNAIGPTYGGILYDICNHNKMWVFLIYLPVLFSISLLLIPVWTYSQTSTILYLPASQMQQKQESSKAGHETPLTVANDSDSIQESAANDDHARRVRPATPIWKLLVDPYIVVIATGLIVANLSHNCLAATIGIWMDHKFNVSDSEKGLVWLPTLPFHFVGSLLTVWLCSKWPLQRYIFAMAGLTMGGLSCLLLPFMSNKILTTLPIGFIFFTIAMADVTLLPMLNHIVDVRHTPVYGSVSAIAYAAFSLASAFGCFASGPIFLHWGFTTLCLILCALGILFSPVLLCTKSYCPRN